MDPIAVRFDLLIPYLLERAQSSPEGRAVHPVNLGHDTLTLTAIGLRAGAELPEHANPGEAVLQVLSGRATLTDGGKHTVDATVGSVHRVPDARHRLLASEPSVVLLTSVTLPL